MSNLLFINWLCVTFWSILALLKPINGIGFIDFFQNVHNSETLYVDFFFCSKNVHDAAHFKAFVLVHYFCIQCSNPSFAFYLMKKDHVILTNAEKVLLFTSAITYCMNEFKVLHKDHFPADLISPLPLSISNNLLMSELETKFLLSSCIYPF